MTHEPDDSFGGPVKLAGQNRIRLVAIGFSVAFLAITLQLANLTVLKGRGAQDDVLAEHQLRTPRPDIVDRNGVVIATDIAVASLYADPRKIIDVEEAVESLTATVPDLDAKTLREKLSQPGKGFVWLKRQVAPEERDAVYNLGIPGVGFVNERRRVYPKGRLAAHTVGYVDLDSKGIAGIEKYLDDQGALYTASLAEGSGESASPAQIATDTRVQYALTDELEKAVTKFKAIAGGGIVLDITTGEIIALVSLPDFNPNQEDKKFSKQQANMMTSGVFELGSVIKAVTFAMAFDYGVTDLNGRYDARFPLVIGNASISDYHAQRRVLTVPEIFTNSSNIGTAKNGARCGYRRASGIPPSGGAV